MKRTALLFFLLVLVRPASAYADSDGYYCVGPNYIAYQFGLAPPPVAPHKLYVVRFTDSGFSEPFEVDLPQFQVHGMRCRETGIDVAGWDAIHTVTLNASGGPIGRTLSRLTPGRLPDWAVAQRNLAHLSRAARTLEPERYRLWIGTDARQMVLDIKGTDDPSSKCTTLVVTRLAELDASSNVIRERTIFRGQAHRDCGGLGLE
jgi:hypothetical protein